MSKMTQYKYVTYHMAHSGNSKLYPKLLARVQDLYPQDRPRYQQAIALALYHSCRCCHRQGYVRWYMDNNLTSNARFMELVSCYDDTTVSCWLWPVANHKAFLVIGKSAHKAWRARCAANRVRVKATKARIAEVGYKAWSLER